MCIRDRAYAGAAQEWKGKREISVPNPAISRAPMSSAWASSRPPAMKSFTPEDVYKSQLEERVWATLKCVYDPEIPVDIVTLGLIYDVTVIELENGLHHVCLLYTSRCV